MRPLCLCGQRPAAINYKKERKVYYRKLCEVCLRHGLSHGIPKWRQSGYIKKDTCEKCGFKSKHQEQFNVFHIDGELNNCRPSNLKTVCANCQIELYNNKVNWKQSPIVPDF